MLIKIALFLLALALTVLLSADWLLAWGVALLPETLARLGIFLLFAGFSLILAGGLVVSVRSFLISLGDYFSGTRRLHRKVLFIADRQQYLEQLLPFKIAHITYFNNQRRKKLLETDSRRHNKRLYKAIKGHLDMLKPQLSHLEYQQWCQECRRVYRLQDVQALLSLQKKIDALEKL